jgi:hypothetical protein
MNVSADDFRRHFELLSDAALLGTNRDDLTEGARTCYDEEVTRRGLDEPSEAIEEEVMQAESEEEQMVEIATFAVAEEASLARGLLDSAGIPLRIATNYVAMGPAEFHLLVPKEFEEHAIEILEHEISDEELAAQAEAAGELELEDAAAEE